MAILVFAAGWSNCTNWYSRQFEDLPLGRTVFFIVPSNLLNNQLLGSGDASIGEKIVKRKAGFAAVVLNDEGPSARIQALGAEGFLDCFAVNFA